MVHAGVPNGAHPFHIIAGYAGALQQHAHKVIGCLCRLAPECFGPARGFGKSDARYQVCTVRGLGVERTCGVFYQSRIAVHEIRHEGGGADIQSHCEICRLAMKLGTGPRLLLRFAL
jgi:hypothetical protein